jgi:ATP-dependent DNA helicase RecG
VNPVELERLLRQDLMPLPAEVEWAEFKEAKSNFHFDKLGEYFSALSNEANLKDRPCAWFVFGITDQPPRRIVGSQYRPNRADLDHLKQEIAAQTTNGITFLDIHELNLPEGRVILFQIPPACRGVPTAWKGHYYGRNGDSIGPLNLQEIEHIRQQGGREDWSAQVCAGASLLDLDPRAVAFARRQYKAKNPGLAAEVDGWDDETFLNKAKVCIAGKITRTAIIHNRGFSREDCKRRVVDYLRQFGPGTRKKIEKVLWDKLSDVLDDEQKRNAVRNLLQEMRRDKTIRKVKGQTKGAVWELSNPAPEASS